MTAVQDGKLGKYLVVGTLGRGAMGTVYDGRDPVIERRVAIKTIPLSSAAEDEEAAAELARFKREAQAAGRLQHPNIVGVYDYGETDTLAYIVMEFVDGTSLKALLDRGERLKPAETVRIMQQVLAALQYSHERGVVHRDVKPANVMITAAGVVKIADFGIARIESSSLTQAGTIMGTPAYMSPEQFMGQTVDARTDIYSAGVLLYQLLTGERPFEGSMTAIMHKALNTVPPRPSEISVTAPSGLDAVVATAMAKRPEQRYQTAAEFAAALAQGAVTAPAAAPDSDATLVMPSAKTAPHAVPPAHPPAPASAPAARNRLPLLAGVAGVVLLIAGVAGYFALRPATAPRSADAGSPAATAPAAAPVQTAPVQTAPVQTAPVQTAPAQTAAVIPPQPVASPPPAATPASAAAAAPASVSAKTAPILAAAPPAEATPTPPEKPVEVAAATPPGALRDAIRAAIAPVGCSLLGGDAGPGDRLRLNGVISSEMAPKLTQAISDAAPSAARDWRVATFKGPYCDLLGLLAPISAGFGETGSGLQVGLRSGDAVLRKDAYIVPTIVMPGWPAYLTVDYFTSDGSLAHLYPAPGNRLQARPPHARVVLGDTTTGAPGWQVASPFGTDLIVAIASEKPLFAKPRQDDDTTQSYLPALRAALEAARQRGEHLAASAEVVRTVEK